MKRGPLQWVGMLGSAFFGLLFGLTLGAAVVAAIATGFMGYHVVVVASDSMQPSMSKGDIVVTKKPDVPKLKEGDVILFSENGVPVIHRIASVRDLVLNLNDADGKLIKSATRYQFVTKGDANPSTDTGETAGEDVIGKLMWRIPGFGIIGDGTDPRVLLFGLAGIIAALWVVWEIGSRLVRRARPAPSGGAGNSGPTPAEEWSPDSLASLTPPPDVAAETPPQQHGEGSSGGVHP